MNHASQFSGIGGAEQAIKGARKTHPFKVLHLVLKGEWYDMINRDEKLEEYREHTDYWRKRLTDGYCTDYPIGTRYLFRPYTYVCFHRGYTSTTMEFKIDSMRLGYGIPEWGAPNNRLVFIIKLGKRLTTYNKL